MKQVVRQSLKPRHIPIRTCVACRQEQPKRQLVRVVLTPSGSVVIDPTGKANGRGAYLCRSLHCWQRAIERRILDGALKTNIGAAEYMALRMYADTNLVKSISITDENREEDTE
jgi:hypothetical protein